MAWFKAIGEGDKKATIRINKAIGSDWSPEWENDFFGETSARLFIDTVEGLGELEEITVIMNCPGGDVSSGIAIMNYLKNHKATIHMRVEGMAASIATVILMAGDTREMGVGATLMVHGPSGWMGGYYTSQEMRDNADAMDKIQASCVEAYVMGTGKTASEIDAVLSGGDTYLTADEAIEWGLATGKDETLQAVASADVGLYQQQVKMSCVLRERNEEIKTQAATIEEMTAKLNPVALDPKQVVDKCQTAGYGALAVGFVQSNITAESLTAKLKMAADISGVCKAANISEAGVLAELGDPVAMMRTIIVEAKAGADQSIDNHISPKTKTVAALNVTAIYDQQNSVQKGH